MVDQVDPGPRWGFVTFADANGANAALTAYQPGCQRREEEPKRQQRRRFAWEAAIELRDLKDGDGELCILG